MKENDKDRVLRLALVDDEPWALIGIRDIICWRDYGFECVYEFGNAEEAYQTLSSDPVDAVITDIRLPEMSGLELAGQLLQESLARVVVIVSAYRDFEYAKRAIVENVMYYLLKPLDRPEVCRVAEMMRDRLRADNLVGTWGRSGFEGENCYVLLETVARTSDTGAWRSIRIPGGGNVWLAAVQKPWTAEEMRPGISRRHDHFDDLRQMIDEAQISWALGFSYCSNDTVSRIQHHIANNYNQRLTNGDLAKSFFMSEVYMSECFKKHTGTTIGSFIITIRIQKAMRLLVETEMSIAEIAESVGYGDASYFSRIFRKRNGITPEQYRRRR